MPASCVGAASVRRSPIERANPVAVRVDRGGDVGGGCRHRPSWSTDGSLRWSMPSLSVAVNRGGTHLPEPWHRRENCWRSSRATVAARPVGAVPEHARPVIRRTTKRQPVLESDQVGNDPNLREEPISRHQRTNRSRQQPRQTHQARIRSCSDWSTSDTAESAACSTPASPTGPSYPRSNPRNAESPFRRYEAAVGAN